ncbi:aromatic acid/H+ symport family MFS transporter [Pseudonocardia sp. C8]|uniref:MFS transporter n=1 Tax=Pseudonocardia sp. C8 TaxID=2762759 RepID=UPI001643166E|nr:aromatic acid/H+ symport family MFS transporter [Pseudonocardia sp. C8]MBC3190697.1 aromatic acid/H+ symport family MFS transporter [Pseudonocardia sp. C8]
MTSSGQSRQTEGDPDLRRRTITWIVGLALVGLIFDGYDLVVYGTLVPVFLRDPSQLGPVDPAQAGALGSYALVGVLVGALMAGSVADIVGRRKVMLTAYAWFSVGMIATAFTGTAGTFGILRFLTGLGVGALVATTGALVAEFAPPGRKNLCNAVTYSGVPLGSLVAALLAILLLPVIGWRGMLLIGGIPLVTLLPLALVRMPESPAWLMSRGRVAEAEQAALRCGIPLAEIASRPSPATAPATDGRPGFGGLFRDYLVPTVLLGLMSAVGLVLVYALNTWLPELMGRAGFSTSGSLSFLLVLNGGAVVGALLASRLADRFGPKKIVAASFGIGAVAIALMTVDLPLAVLLAFVAVVGLGTSGTQILIYGFVATYYRTNVRSAGVAWCAGFGRLGGVGGPLVGGLMVASGLALDSIFYVLAALAVAGVVLTWLVPGTHRGVPRRGERQDASTAAAN